jgi:hypothetical protein
MGKYGPDIGPNIGNASRMPGSVGAHNFQRSYYKNAGSGDTRVHYEDLYFDSTGGGEVIRVRGIANSTTSAGTGTINAIHATGRIAAGMSCPNGALHAIRATLEIAGATPSPSGTFAALNLDSNIVTGSLHPLATTAFIRVSQSGQGMCDTLMLLPATEADDHNADVLSTAGVDKPATHYIRIMLGTTPAWIMATTTAPAHS